MVSDPPAATSSVGQMLRRWWWLMPIGALVGLVAGYVVTPEPQYTTSFRATVLIPGDTEDTGSAERPELMVLDDLGPFAESRAFADLVAEETVGEVTVAKVDGMVSGSRYSRIATIDISGDDPEVVTEVAEAAAAVFPSAVNEFLVADGAPDATVRIIDPPIDPERDTSMRWVRVGATGLLGAGVVLVGIVLSTPDTPARRAADG